MTKNPASEFVAPERFAVSHLGMRELHENRPPWQLVKELIQNSWDEAPESTVCTVEINVRPHEQTTLVTVNDDGPGFSDISDAWTLMKHTAKRQQPNKRGRFNMGEKEIVSVALEAEVETVGHTVTFPRIGSRVVSPNQRARGTRITALMPWNRQQAEELVAKLATFRPTDCRLVVNKEEVIQREPLSVRSAILNTVLQEGPGQPMRPTRRRTDIHVLTPHDPAESWLYEMGIPVQPIGTPWDVDVMQKIPMPPNRDTVSEAYLSDIYAEVLNAEHEIMEPHQFGEQWVKQAVEDPRTESPAIASTVAGRYGPKVLLTSPDPDANMKAAEDDYELVNPRSLSKIERDRFRVDAGLQNTRQVFGSPAPVIEELDPETPDEIAFAQWVVEVGKMAGLRVAVKIINDEKAHRLADCTAATPSPTVRFNRASLPPSFFAQPYPQPDQLELVMHELGHAVANKPMEHGPAWGDGVAHVGAMIAAGLLAKAESRHLH